VLVILLLNCCNFTDEVVQSLVAASSATAEVDVGVGVVAGVEDLQRCRYVVSHPFLWDSFSLSALTPARRRSRWREER